MSQDQFITWHPDAVLVDRDNARITYKAASVVTATANCDPVLPRSALPGFINAIAAGMVPIMGQFEGSRPTGRGDFLTQTGGSTGQPKTILRSSESWLLSFAHMAGTYGISPKANVAALGHLNHSLALYAGLEALHTGAMFHALGGMPVEQYGRTLASRNITHLYATPTQLRLIRSMVIPSVKYILIGGGALNETDKQQAALTFPNAEVVQFYGAAETSFIALSDAQTPSGSVGKAFDNVTIKIRTDAGKSCLVGVIGHVWVKSPLAYTGYLPAHSKAYTKGEFITVGELGYLDQNGYLFLKGRADRAVTIKDQLIYLDAVEAALIQMRPITNAAVFALPDSLRGFKLAAIVSTSRADIDPTAIIQNMPQHLRPRQISVVQNWPLLPSGKTDYITLERQLK